MRKMRSLTRPPMHGLIRWSGTGEGWPVVRVKICGITDVKDARLAARLGADALGFNFVPGSPRYIEPARAKAIIAALPPFVSSVGVFANEDPDRIMEIARLCNLDAVQFHGEETPAMVERVTGIRRIKAIRVRNARDIARCARYRVDAYLLDAYVPGMRGGTGRTFNWELARQAVEFGPVILAGGLTPENVEEAARIVQPYAVDTASGVEVEPGVKDKNLLAEFIWRVKSLGV